MSSSMSDRPTPALLDQLTQAALPHVAFDGWSDATLIAAAQDAGIDPEVARGLCPRGGLDLALSYHRMGDVDMLSTLASADLSTMRFRDRVAYAVRLRLEHADREAVRRAAALMALPQNAPAGARAMWSTADQIWTALGDTSEDGNWYSKRAILSGVYSSTVLYWLGDESEDQAETWAFLDRRIGDVMSFEQSKAKINASPLLRNTVGLPLRLLERLRKPGAQPDLPGAWRTGPNS